MFSNIESLWKFHQMFLPALKTSKENDVAAVIAAHADYLKVGSTQTQTRVWVPARALR